jgi:protein deglycase
MSKKVLVPIADGSEEIESVAIIDVLRRAGADVTVASVNDLQVTCSRGVRITADVLIADCVEKNYDLIALPGGIPGAENLRDSSVLTEILTKQARDGRYYAALCAAPQVVLAHHGLIGNKKVTGHPLFVDHIMNKSDVDSRVVVDDNLITSRGPGTAIEFALKLVELLYGEEKARETAAPMLAK